MTAAARRCASPVLIRGPVAGVRDDCERILRSLPAWFGIASALQTYADATEALPTFVAVIDGRIVGFVSLEKHSPDSSEIHCVAVDQAFRNDGVGSVLLAAAEDWSKAGGARILLVKTLADSHPSPAYRATRAFYRQRGFVDDQLFPELWGVANPCLQLRKNLDT